jgi:hypothetical protein
MFSYEVREYREEMIDVLVGLAVAANAVLQSDGTDRLSIEELRTAHYAYKTWLLKDTDEA